MAYFNSQNVAALMLLLLAERPLFVIRLLYDSFNDAFLSSQAACASLLLIDAEYGDASSLYVLEE